MKKRFFILSLIILCGVVFWLSRSTPEVLGIPGDHSAPSSRIDPAAADLSPRNALDEDTAAEAAYAAQRALEFKKTQEQQQRQYSTSIVFYGLVLDQFSQPVPQAHVRYMNADSSGNWKWKEMPAGDNGAFTIHSVQGRYLDVQVDHQRYYKLPESNHSFTYAGNDRGPDFKPDPANPVIFRLLKKGDAAELVRREDRVRFDGAEPERSFSFYDHSRRRDQADYVILRRVETPERDSKGQPIRRLEMAVPGGGIQQRSDPFAFMAPDTGYKPKMYFMRIPGQPLDYFVKFPNGNYGRFTIMGTAGDYLIESFLNPDRSPNLEYDPAKEITVVQTGKMGVDLLYPASDKPLPDTPQPASVQHPRRTLRDQRRETAPNGMPPK